MANIKQQKKRIRVSERQRMENLRYRSTAKTLFRSIVDQVNAGNKEGAETAHGQLVKLLDRGIARKVFHSNTAARKKARAWRALNAEPVKAAKVVRKAKKKAAPVRAKKTRKDEAVNAAVATEAVVEAPAETAEPVTAEAEAAPAEAADTEATEAEATSEDAPSDEEA